jgi:hypothetical protein
VIILYEKENILVRTGQLGIQTIPVIIGVYLGLIANEYSQNRKEQQRTQTMKERLWNEIDANHSYLENVIICHQFFFVDTSSALLSQSKTDIYYLEKGLIEYDTEAKNLLDTIKYY